MKLVSVLAVLAFSCLASATPAVGDSSKFALTMTSGSETAQGTAEISLISQNGNTFQMAQNVVIGNNPAEYSEQTVKASDLLDDATITDILAQCPQYGGTAEEITVPAGTFASCKMAQQDATFWIGQVAFGFLKQITIDQSGTVTTLDLMSSVSGK